MPGFGQSEERILLHAQQGYATAHIFEAAVRLIPMESLTHKPGDMGTIRRVVVGYDAANGVKLLGREVSAAIAAG
jgi:hypothetical protein